MEENKYSRGKIYKIVDNTNGNIYVGSTTEPTLARRLAKHRNSYKRYLDDDKRSYMTSFIILENGDYDIVLIENADCESKDQLRAIERHYIETLDCVNKRVEGRTISEWYNANKEKLQKQRHEYYETNKQHFKEIHKNYYKNNLEVIKSKNKIHYEKNKIDILKRQKDYIERNKTKILDYRKEYGLKNRTKLIEKSKNYYNDNKEDLLLKNKVYRDNHKDEVSEYHNQYRKKNKDKVNQRQYEKFECACGGNYTYAHKAEHCKSKKHQIYLEDKTNL
jgi:hypothetical protein